MSKRYRRRVTGLLPRLGGALLGAAGWIIRHPQPWLVCVALSAATWGLWKHVHHVDTFRISHVLMPSHATLQVPPSMIGTNIWDVDIRDLAAQLQRQQPWLKDVRVVRELPDRLRIDVVLRTTTAQVRLDHWYAVDREGYILPQGSSRPAEELVQLIGTESPQAPLRTGRVNTSGRLQLALRVLETLQRDPVVAARALQTLDVSDPRQISFVIDGGAEIRCGSEHELPAHLERLHATLERVARQQVDIRYIDVRFQEPVVSPRT